MYQTKYVQSCCRCRSIWNQRQIQHVEPVICHHWGVKTRHSDPRVGIAPVSHKVVEAKHGCSVQCVFSKPCVQQLGIWTPGCSTSKAYLLTHPGCFHVKALGESFLVPPVCKQYTLPTISNWHSCFGFPQPHHLPPWRVLQETSST